MNPALRQIVFVLVAGAVLAGAVAFRAPYLDTPMMTSLRSSLLRFRPDTATGG